MIKFKVMENSKIRTALLCFYLFFPIFALANNTADAITMVSYEQGWLDSRGTLALKNNTNEEIHNVSFQITYLDMSGNPLDYEEFTKSISIAPGMTRKIDIPAYEHNRNYHYYKTKDEFGHPAFKIKFTLKDYNSELQEADDADDYGIYDNDDDSRYSSSKNDSLYMIIAIVAVLFVIGISVGLYVLVAVMAKNRNRSVILWVLLSIVASPLLIIIILLVVGDDNKRIDSDMP